MKRLFLFLSVFLPASILFAQSRGFVKIRQEQEDHIALIIGNSAYPDMPLENPTNDADAVAKAFKEMGFIVEKVLDADKEEMAMAIDRFSKKMATARVAVFYFAGHGMQVDGENYLIPIGRSRSTQINKAEQVPYRAVNAGEVLTAMENNQIKFSLIVLDACRNNPIGGSRGKLKGLASIDAPAGSLVMYATKAGGVSIDDVEGSKNSPFTIAFLKHIGTPGLDVNLLPSRVTQTVRELTNNAQTPGSYVQISQSFTFVPEFANEEIEKLKKEKDNLLARLKQQISDRERKENEEKLAETRRRLQDQQDLQREQTEIAQKQAEIDALDRQIANIKKQVSGSSGSLDEILKIKRQREAEDQRLQELKKKAEQERKRREKEAAERKRKLEAERQKREQEIQQMKEKKFYKNLAKYKEIANSELMQDMKPAAWSALLKEMGLENGSVKIDDTRTLRKKLGLQGFEVPVAGMSIKMRGIQGGTFQMGTNDFDDCKPVHTVTVGDFAIMKYEVTFAEYDKFCDATGRSKPSDSGWGRGSRPVMHVSWNDAMAYAKWLSQKTGQTWRLPTEAEWEYAARGGITGGHAPLLYAGSNNLNDVAWYWDNAGKKTHPVGQKSPNGYGLYDMSGNVWEWCSDWYGNYNTGSQNNPQGAKTGSYRVLRGGSWDYRAKSCRSASRSGSAPADSYGSSGFRLVSAFSSP